MTKKEAFNIKQAIETKRETITKLLHANAKHLDDISWIKSAFIKETLILNQCPDHAVRHETCSESIHNINVTWDIIVSRTNITKFSILDVIDIHCNLAHNTDVIPGKIRTASVYNLQTLIPATPSQEVTRQRIDDILYRLNSGKQSILQRAFDAHYDLIMLQPFTDFNKRIARMLMNWFLINHGYRPIAFNKRGDKNAYIQALQARASGDKRAYTDYMSKCQLRTQCDIIKHLKNSKIY